MSQAEIKYSAFKFTALKYKGSVIKHVIPKLVFFLGWTSAIVAINRLTSVKLAIPDSLSTLTTLVLSLLLVFRTNTAYDRYWEGRRLWSSMTVAIRALARNIWVHVHEKGDYDKKAKEKALDLLIAFPVAVKHYLRSEHGTEFADLNKLIAHIPRYAVPSSLDPIYADLPDRINDPNVPLEFLEKDNEAIAPTNLPIEIAFCISTFIAEYAGKNQLAPPVNSVMIANVNSLVDSLSGFERILRTPIPIAYSVHLSQITWLFCLTLPFQLLSKFMTPANSLEYKDMLIIPVVAIVVFTSFGIINIGEEIENPFGYDDNDLPLEEYCQILKKEINAITAKPPPSSFGSLAKKNESSTAPVATTTAAENASDALSNDGGD